MTEEENGEEVTIEEFYADAAERAEHLPDFLHAALPHVSEIEPFIKVAELPRRNIELFREALNIALPKLKERGLAEPGVNGETIEQLLAKMSKSLPALMTQRVWAAICHATMESYYHARGGPLTEREMKMLERLMIEAGRNPAIVIETRGQRGITTIEMIKALEKLGDEAAEAEQKDVARILHRTARSVQRWQDRKGFDDWKAARKFCIERIPKVH